MIEFTLRAAVERAALSNSTMPARIVLWFSVMVLVILGNRSNSILAVFPVTPYPEFLRKWTLLD